MAVIFLDAYFQLIQMDASHMVQHISLVASYLVLDHQENIENQAKRQYHGNPQYIYLHQKMLALNPRLSLVCHNGDVVLRKRFYCHELLSVTTRIYFHRITTRRFLIPPSIHGFIPFRIYSMLFPTTDRIELL